MRGRLGSAAAVAALVVVKLFPWPLAVWLMVTKRWRLAAVAAALAVAVTAAVWAAIGFDGLTAYPGMLRDLAFIEADASVSLSARSPGEKRGGWSRGQAYSASGSAP